MFNFFIHYLNNSRDFKNRFFWIYISFKLNIGKIKNLQQAYAVEGLSFTFSALRLLFNSN